ncbi:NAD-dependent dehydratase [Kribbella antibiotica]|uniref:NAD-dependent dehydratase n=1 Tax=Kribbella antibiotica TaxID=190195 RepID=A0A4R4YW39_9ACTN|nr:NAD-dependent dehydratase [Kribbella antibiotica]TDD49100.1 NAD-dependent dehydratase [Kribbella antibiotica]
MRLLVLGGTKNLGRHVVEAALRLGHDVTLFNRGTTNPSLFPDVRRIVGDRADPSALAAGEWDRVIDMSGLVVRDVGLSAEVLRDRVGHYTFMSTIGVYTDKVTPGQDESGALLPWPVGAPDNEFRMDLYGPSKVRCESLLAATFGSRTTAVRSGFVVGPYNPDFGNWGTALAQGTRMECAARPGQPVQYVDARDLADFLLLEVSGAFNVVGPSQPMAELAAAWQSVVPAALPMDWEPAVDRFHLEDDGLFQLDNARALEAGLRLRPDAEAARDYVAWIRDGNVPPDPPH